MANYEALVDFTDLQDNHKKYKKGDTYPSPTNKKVSDKRIKELTTTSNVRKTKIIKEIKKVKKAKEQE